MVTHSSFLTCRILLIEEPGGLQSMGSKESDITEVTQHTHACTHTGISTFPSVDSLVIFCKLNMHMEQATRSRSACYQDSKGFHCASSE